MLNLLRQLFGSGFSRSEYTEEYPNDVAKVEKLLTMLDNSQVLHAIKQSRGKRHVPAFTRRHNEAVQRTAQERGATVRKSRRCHSHAVVYHSISGCCCLLVNQWLLLFARAVVY